MEEIKIDIYFDGACKNVKGSTEEPYGVGCAVYINDEYSETYSLSFFETSGTSNVAEWEGCLKAMQLGELLWSMVHDCMKEFKPVIRIFGDSELIVKQFNGEYQVKQDRFAPFYFRARAVARSFEFSKITWIPREQNQKADDLSKEGLEKYRDTLYYWYLHDESNSIFIERREVMKFDLMCEEIGECKLGTNEELVDLLKSYKSPETVEEIINTFEVSYVRG